MSYSLDEPVFCIEYFFAKQNCQVELITELKKLVKPTRAEPGCLQYDLLLDSENPHIIIMIVKFISQEAMTAHEQQPYIEFFSKNIMDTYCEKLVWNYAKEII